MRRKKTAKEELEKEAKEYALEWGDKTDGTYASCRDGYLAGAEPREKRIEELEKENAELKESNSFLNNLVKEKEQRGLEIQEDLLKEKEKLEKENAELKEKLKPENCLKYLAKGGYVKFFCEYGNEHEQISKAKELIQTLSTCLEGHHTNSFEYEQIKQAEAFLSEVEK